MFAFGGFRMGLFGKALEALAAPVQLLFHGILICR